MNRLPQRTSLVAQTAAIIAEEIEAGTWAGWLPGEYELCEQLHVSRTTLRGALDQLHRDGRIKCHQGRRREIVSSRHLPRKGQSKCVVALMPDPLKDLLFRAFLVDRLREHLAREGYSLEIHVSKVPFRARRPHEMEKLAAMLNPAGWVLMNSSEQMQRWFATRRIPCVLAGSRHADIELPSVDTDYRAVCRHAVGKFLSRGHTRIVLLNPDPAGAGDVLAETVFREATAQAPSVEGIVVTHKGTLPDICARLDSLMARRERPTAFFISRARHALTVMCYLLKEGYRVPQDVALISRDDEPYMEDIVPVVTRYSNNPKLFALKLSRAVTAMVRGTQKITDQKVMPKFITGETLG